MSSTLKLKRNETFSIRDGWLEKAINIIPENNLCLKKENGPKFLGLGSNMCKSLRFWLEASKIATFSNGTATLTEFGNLLHRYDPFLDTKFSWWIIHLNLVSDFEENPVFNTFFNITYDKFDKEQVFIRLKDYYSKNDFEISSESSLESDIGIVLKSYYNADFSNPENNLKCPLSNLNLLDLKSKKVYVRNAPTFDSLDYRIVFYSILLSLYFNNINISFNIQDYYELENTPLKFFNLSKSSFLLYLEEMKKNGLITLIKTAGLNTVTILKKLTLTEIFESYFTEDKNA